MRAMMAMGATALMVASPASAQTGVFPDKMLGRWCGTFNSVRFCVAFARAADGSVSLTHTAREGDAAEHVVSSGVIRTENGVLVLRSAARGSEYREVPHGADELLVENAIPENVKRGAALRIGYTVEGDTLVVGFVLSDGGTASQRYDRMGPKEDK